MRRAVALVALILAGPVAAEEIVLGLSQDEVAITATFDGSDILIFGAVRREAPPPQDPPLAVVMTVSGPLTPVMVRRADRVAGIWMNTDAIEVDAAPSFYAIATSAPLAEALSDTEDLRHTVTIPRAIRSVGHEIAGTEAFTDALIRIRSGEGRYQVLDGAVDLEQDTLFRARVSLPANLVEGDYDIRIFLTRGGQVIDSHAARIPVQKVGLERWLHALAHERPLIYGILSLILAVAAGWGASALFSGQRR